MRIADALARAAARGLPRLDAQLLLLHALGRKDSDRAWLLAHDDELLDPAAGSGFESLCERRAAGEPVAYLLGRKEFFGLELDVDSRVLVPRPETETLVEWALELLRDRSSCRAIDLGTGSGAIALALARRAPQVSMDAVDASADALAVAASNGERLGLDVRWRHGDWLDGCEEAYDLIVANPPYVADADDHLPALRHEPLSALAAGPDGLRELRRIVAQAPSRLAHGGWLLLEHGWDQAAPVRAMLAAAGFMQVQSRRDLAGIERCSGGQWPERG